MKLIFPSILLIVFIIGCGGDKVKKEEVRYKGEGLKPYPVTTKELPANLKWKTNADEPTFASPEATSGGTYTSYERDFPPTLRDVGPDSNGYFATVVRSMSMNLINFHPNTENIIPCLATHWAYGDDGKTLYYKLDPNAKWSNGRPVTADDFLYTIEFMRSEHIKAPWYNNHYSKMIIEVRKYDDHTIAIEGATVKAKKDLHYYYNVSPRPRHFYGNLDENFVKEYNWKIPPVTGPYVIDEKKIKKGKSITLTRVKNWWGNDYKYFKHRFNVDQIVYKVIRDLNVAFEHFLKGELDSFMLTMPRFWHDKAKGEVFDKGYIHKLWFFTDTPQPKLGMFLNMANDFFKDKNIRLAFAHSMNIKKLLKTVLRGDYFRLNHGYVGYGEYSNKNLQPLEFDLEKADHYFKLAGWDKRGPDGIRIKDGKKFSVSVTYSVKEHTDRLVLLREEAKKAGVDLILDNLDPTTSFKKILEKKHQVAWSGWSVGLRPAFWQHYHSENANKPQTNNITNSANPELDKLIMQYRNSSDEAERINLSKKIQSIIHDEVSFIPTYMVPYFREGYWRYWKFPDVPATKTSEMALDPFPPAGGLFWLDQSSKEKTLNAVKSEKPFQPFVEKDTTYKSF